MHRWVTLMIKRMFFQPPPIAPVTDKSISGPNQFLGYPLPSIFIWMCPRRRCKKDPPASLQVAWKIYRVSPRQSTSKISSETAQDCVSKTDESTTTLCSVKWRYVVATSMKYHLLSNVSLSASSLGPKGVFEEVLEDLLGFVRKSEKSENMKEIRGISENPGNSMTSTESKTSWCVTACMWHVGIPDPDCWRISKNLQKISLPYHKLLRFGIEGWKRIIKYSKNLLSTSADPTILLKISCNSHKSITISKELEDTTWIKKQLDHVPKNLQRIPEES